MDLISLIIACAISAHTNTVPVLYKIANVHDGNPLVIEVVDQTKVYNPTTTTQAIGIATALIETGAHIRVGLAQVDASDAIATYGVTIADIFDDCRNIAIGADQITLSLESHPTVPTALAAYFSGNPSSPHGKAWAKEVLSQPSAPSHDDPSSESSVMRRYSSPQRRIFAHESNTEHRDPQPHPTKQIIANPERLAEEKATEKETTEEQVVEEQVVEKKTTGEEVTDEEDQEENDSWPHPTKINRQQIFRAQPPVTDERLPTTSELNGTQP